MYKIAAFIEFDKKINDKVLGIKKKVKKKFGNQMYLNHPVHLTLFTLKIKKISELKNIYKKTNYTSRKKPFIIKVNSPGVFKDDPLTGGHTIIYNIRANKKIKEVQLRHLNKINKKIKVLKSDISLFKSSILKKNYIEYGFPFAGKIWIPHITIASIKNISPNHKFIINFLGSKINLKSLISEIKFYKIIKDKHIFLFSVKNI